jgi:hypothetical protein
VNADGFEDVVDGGSIAGFIPSLASCRLSVLSWICPPESFKIILSLPPGALVCSFRFRHRIDRESYVVPLLLLGC